MYSMKVCVSTVSIIVEAWLNFGFTEMRQPVRRGNSVVLVSSMLNYSG